jgi:hypothetical protein
VVKDVTNENKRLSLFQDSVRFAAIVWLILEQSLTSFRTDGRAAHGMSAVESILKLEGNRTILSYLL